MLPDWARTGPGKDRGCKQIFFPHRRAQNPKRTKATLPDFHEESR
jgi:hypothetical protein